MNCPKCGAKLKCVETRPRASNATYRRYKCSCQDACVYTMENIIQAPKRAVYPENTPAPPKPTKPVRYACLWDKMAETLKTMALTRAEIHQRLLTPWAFNEDGKKKRGK